MKKSLRLLVLLIAMCMMSVSCIMESHSSKPDTDKSSNKYIVKFNANGGSGTMSDMTVDIDEEITLPVCAYTRVGWTFSGWKAADGTVYQDKAKVSNLTEAGKTVTLYAQWLEHGSHSIFYNNIDDDETNSNPTTFKEAQTITLQGVTKKGHTFGGWYENESCSGEAVTGWAAGAKTSDVTLWAKWTANHYVVTLDNSDCDIDVDVTLDAVYGQTLPNVVVPTRIGYDFDGYYQHSVSGLMIRYIDETGTGSRLWRIDRDETLTPQFTENDSHRIWYLNVKKANISDMPLSYREADEVTLPDIAYTGYVFDGWYEVINDLTSDTKTTGWAAGEHTADVTFWAKWTPIQYKICFDANGGTGTMSEQNAVYGENVTLPKCTFIQSGHKFSYWSVETGENAAVRYNDEATVLDLTADNDAVITFYAHWTPAEWHLISYNNLKNADNSANPAAFTVDEAVTLQDITTAGYTFSGWYESDDYSGDAITGWTAGTKTADVTLWARWTPRIDTRYTVQRWFLSGDDNNQKPEQNLADYPDIVKSGETGTMTDITADDYQIAGFNILQIGNVTIAPDGSSIVAIIYGRKTIIYTFSANGGEWGDGTTADKTLSGLYEDSVGNVQIPMRTGYTFSGWDKTVPSVFDNENVTFTAQWTPIHYKIRFTANLPDGSQGGGSGSMAELNMTYDETTVLPANSFVRTGYVFHGWRTSYRVMGEFYSDCASVKNLADTDGETVTLYAHWYPITYKITFDANGGSGTMSEKDMTYDESASLPKNAFTKIGYKFTGWNTDPSGTGTNYADCASVKNLTDTSGGNVTLYAQWETAKAKLKFYAHYFKNVAEHDAGSEAEYYWTFKDSSTLFGLEQLNVDSYQCVEMSNGAYYCFGEGKYHGTAEPTKYGECTKSYEHEFTCGNDYNYLIELNVYEYDPSSSDDFVGYVNVYFIYSKDTDTWTCYWSGQSLDYRDNDSSTVTIGERKDCVWKFYNESCGEVELHWGWSWDYE